MGRDQAHDLSRSVRHGGQLVHLPSCVPVPLLRYWWCAGCGEHPGWLLRVRHYLEVRRGSVHLPDHRIEVRQGVQADVKIESSGDVLLFGRSIRTESAKEAFNLEILFHGGTRVCCSLQMLLAPK